MTARRRPEKVTAAITGAGGGLGRAVALSLARSGMAVACSDVAGPSVEETAALVAKIGGRATADVVDLTDEAQVTDWAASVTMRLGAPTVLVNCGGILDRRALDDVTVSEFMAVVSVNLAGTYSAVRAFRSGMVGQGWGRIVNIASIAGLNGYPFAAYAASKAGVVNLSKSLLPDFWGTGVTVNSVCPGAMMTAMLDAEATRAMIAQTPSGELADPADVAGIVEFLCSDTARSINGASLVVDGGATAVFGYGSPPYR